MYEYLEGEVALRSPTRLVVDVAGVGYELAVPFGSALPSHGRARVYTHLVVREDAHLLFGFPDRESRHLFRQLLSVRGIGPMLALGILSGLPSAALLDAIADEDPRPLTSVKGVGKKTAEQIILDLKSKVAGLRAELGAGQRAPSAPAAGSDAREDAAAALVSLGYSEKEARRAVEQAAARVDPGNLEELVRCALRG